MKNRDKYKTAREQDMAFSAYCGERECDECELSDNIGGNCAFWWLEAEYLGSRVEACPYCGEHCSVRKSRNHDGTLRYYVACDAGCGYSSCYCDGKGVIDLHNSVSRVIRDYKENGPRD